MLLATPYKIELFLLLELLDEEPELPEPPDEELLLELDEFELLEDVVAAPAFADDSPLCKI